MNSSCSIAMTTYNGQAYLREQLDSIGEQTLLPFEVIICDDQSTDKTAEIVADFARRVTFPVRFVVNESRLGFGLNFMKAASLCSGDFITFSDQDDVWDTSKISEVQKFFSDSDCMLVAHDFSVFFQSVKKPDIKSYFEHLRASGFSRVLSIKGCTLTIRKSLIDQIGWPSDSVRDLWAHDNWVCFVAALMGNQGYIDKPLIRHRIHGLNTSGVLTGGRDRIRKFLRGIHCPPLTSRQNLDVFLGYFFRSEDKEIFLDAIQQCAKALSEQQLRRARAAYINRIVFLDFPGSKTYSKAITRIPCALGMFLRGVYRNGDGVLGLVQDIYGNRNGKI